MANVSDATVYRLSLYHCFLGEMLKSGDTGRIRSRQLAHALDIKEETVRRDLSFIGGVGRPGSGYDSLELMAALQEFLGLKDEYPIVKVGSAQMIEALGVVFPASSYGVRPVAYYSELASDAGRIIDGIEVRSLDTLPATLPALGVNVALLACAPEFVQRAIDLLAQAGVTGILLLTPTIRVDRPEGVQVTHVRMPCDIKSLACRCKIVRHEE